jgi:hypothetical protein
MEGPMAITPKQKQALEMIAAQQGCFHRITGARLDRAGLIVAFGAAVDAALARDRLERARKDAKLDAFLGEQPFLDARRNERGVYVIGESNVG